MTKPLSQCREDAFILNGLVRGLVVLHEDNGPDARDGVSALIEVLKARTEALALGLDALDAAAMAERAAGAPPGARAPAAPPRLEVLEGKAS